MRAAATKAKTRLSKRVTKDSEKKERSLAVIELERKKYKSFIGGINSINEILDNHRPTKKYLNATGSSEIKSKLSPYLFRPDESRKVIWDIWIASLIMFSIIDIPLRIGFQIPSDSGAEIFDYILDGFFFVDILANFNTIIIENNDKMIINRNIIAFRYLKFWFWLDLISTMPFDNIVESVLNQNAGNALTAVRLIRIVRLVRLLKLVRVFRLRNISEHMEKLQIHPAILNVLKLLFQVFLIAHIVSCFWYFLTTGDVVGFNTTTGEVQKINTWITDHPLIDNGDLGTKYVASLYWTVATMVAVGYGDIHAVNIQERLFSIGVMLGGGILFGAIIGETIRIVEGRNPQAQLIKEKLNDLKGYLAEKPLSMGLKKDIKVAYTYYLQKKTSFGDQPFKELPFNLLEKLVYKMFEREIACIELLQSSDKLFVIRLVQFCQPLYCAIGDILYDCGDVTNEFVFIMKGLVSISTADSKTVNILAGYATEGHFCMDFEYLMNTLSLARYQVAEQSNIFVIKYTVIADACSDFVESSLSFREELVRRYKNFKEVLALDFEATRTHVQKKFLSNQSPKFQTEYRRPVFWIDGFQRDSFDRHQSNVEFSIFDEKGYGDIRVLVKTSDATFQITKVTRQSLIKKLIVNPDGRVKLRWDILIIIFILYSVLYIPVQLAFDTPSSQAMNIFNDIVDAVFVSDLFISSRTAYYDDLDDAYMIDPKSIYNRYLKTWFLVDFFSGVPFDSIVKAVVDIAASNLLSIRLIKVIRLMRLLKLARLLKLSKYIYKIEDALDIPPALFELLVLMLRVLFLGHFLACIWWGLTTVLSNDPWYKETEFQPQGTTFMDCGTDEKYVASLYWTFTTLATVGYGDYVSVNTYERLLNIFIMLIGATTFGYIVANVSSTFGSLNQSQTLKREKIGAISSILSEKNISENLSASIINHFKNVYSKVSMYDEETILTGLPNRLNNRIAIAIYKDTMQKISIFKFIENQSVALYIFNILQPLNFQYGQVILKEDTASLEICFLLSGEAIVYKQLKGSKMQNYLFNWNTNLTKKLNPTRLEPIRNLSQEHELKLKRGRDIAMSIKKTRFQKGNSESKYSVIDDSVKTALDAETEPDEMVLDDKLCTSNLHLSRNDSENNISRGNESFLNDKSNSSTFDAESDHGNKTSFFSSINSNTDSTSANLFLTDDDIIKLGFEPLARYGSGDFFGHSSFLKEINYNASVVALSSCSTYSLQKSEVVKLVIASPPIAMILQSAIGKAIHALFRSRGKEEVSKKRASFLTTIKLRHVLHRHQRKLKEEKLKKELYSKKKTFVGLEPLNHTLRRLSLRQVIPITTTFKSSKWGIVRKAVRDAKVSSIVATMVDGVKKHPSDKKASDHFRMALNKSFGVSLEAVLNESAIHYDSESSYEDEDEINVSEKYQINYDGKNERPINLKRIKKKALIRRCHSLSIIGKSDTEDDAFNIISESEKIKRRRASFPSSSQHFKEWKKCRIDNVV